ncbi:MAG: HEAT repeat domain-containing protein [bacterium]
MRKSGRATAIALMTLVCGMSLLRAADTTNPAQAGLLATLQKADASHEQKAAACRELALVGNKDAVPVLAAMLGDEKLAHMARYALEPIADPSVDKVLREALEKLNGNLLLGVIGSIGARRDQAAVEPLSKLLRHQDQQVVRAAANALGKMATLPAGKALSRALEEVKGDALPAVGDALLKCAARLADTGQKNDALRFYAAVRKMETPQPIRLAATRGVILCGGKDGLKILAEQLTSDNLPGFMGGLGVAMEISDKKVVPVLVDVLGKIPPDRAAALIPVLGRRGDEAALPALLDRAKSGEKPLRLAAIAAVAEIGKASSVPALIELLKDPDGEIVRGVVSGLAGMPGTGVDEAIFKMLECQDESLRLKMLDLAGQRKIVKALPVLVKGLSDQNKAVRGASIRSCGELAGAEQFPALLDTLVKTQEAGEAESLERILGTVCSMTADKDPCSAKLVDALAKATPASKQPLVRLLGVVGGPAALAAVRSVAGDADPEMRLTAIRVLSACKTADAAPVLLGLIKEAADDKEKLLSLRGYLGIATQYEKGKNVKETSEALQKVVADWKSGPQEQARAMLKQFESEK